MANITRVLPRCHGRFEIGQCRDGQLGMACRFHAARHKRRELSGRQVPSCSGLAILSAREPCGHGALPLPDDPRDGDRWAHVNHDCSDRLVLLGGDLNAEPDAPALHWLERQQACVARAAWREPGVAGPLATHPPVAYGACLDHLYRFESKAFTARWSEVRRVLDVPDARGCHASDHAAVLGRLVIERDGMMR